MPKTNSIAAVRQDDDTNTARNAKAIHGLVAEAKVVRIVLFATSDRPTGAFNDARDGGGINLPLVAALAEVKLDGISPIYVVFDGMFLTARSKTRYNEVRDLLDASVASGKVYFSAERAPFTSGLPASEAAAALLDCASGSMKLTAATRGKYFAMLSTITEEDFAIL